MPSETATFNTIHGKISCKMSKYVSLTHVRGDMISCSFTGPWNNRWGHKFLKCVYTALRCVKLSAFMADKDGVGVVYLCDLFYEQYWYRLLMCSLSLSSTLDPRPTTALMSVCMSVCIWLRAISRVKCRGSECVYTRFPLIQPRDSQRNSMRKDSDCLKDQPELTIQNNS